MMKETKTGTYVRNKETHGFKFYTNLTVADKNRFVYAVTSNLVDDDNYHSVLRDIFFDYMIVKFFTDIDTSDIKESENSIDVIEEFLEETNIVDIVKANMEIGLLEELNHAVNLNVQYKTGIHYNPLNDALSSLINTIEKKINEVDLNSMMEMVDVFSGMAGDITPESVVNAYLKSDVHKNNLIEIEESKKQNGIIAMNLDTAIKEVNSGKKKSSKSKK